MSACKWFILLLGIALVGCSERREVEFAWFNVSGHEIRVTGISGLPLVVTPGVLVPVSDDTNRLNESGLHFFETIRVEDPLKIIWQEGGASRQVQFTRSDAGLPPKLTGGQVRFTYVGDGSWRLRVIGHNSERVYEARKSP
jgi:hypothetical protein